MRKKLELKKKSILEMNTIVKTEIEKDKQLELGLLKLCDEIKKAKSLC